MGYKSIRVERNDDGTYAVTVDGKQYILKDTYELAHFLEVIGA